MSIDLPAGSALPEVSFIVNATAMKVTTLLTDDPNPIHFDPAAVDRLGIGPGLVNQGVLNLAYPVNSVLALLDGDPTNIRSMNFRFLNNVLEGDVVTAGGQVAEFDEAAETIRLDLWLDVEGGDRALAGTMVLWNRSTDGQA